MLNRWRRCLVRNAQAITKEFTQQLSGLRFGKLSLADGFGDVYPRYRWGNLLNQTRKICSGNGRFSAWYGSYIDTRNHSRRNGNCQRALF